MSKELWIKIAPLKLLNSTIVAKADRRETYCWMKVKKNLETPILPKIRTSHIMWPCFRRVIPPTTRIRLISHQGKTLFCSVGTETENVKTKSETSMLWVPEGNCSVQNKSWCSFLTMADGGTRKRPVEKSLVCVYTFILLYTYIYISFIYRWWSLLHALILISYWNNNSMMSFFNWFLTDNASHE